MQVKISRTVGILCHAEIFKVNRLFVYCGFTFLSTIRNVISYSTTFIIDTKLTLSSIPFTLVTTFSQKAIFSWATLGWIIFHIRWLMNSIRENGERKTENGERRMENKTTENGEQKRGRRKSNATGETGYGEKITEVWGRKSVVNLHNNSKWRMTSRKKGINFSFEQALFELGRIIHQHGPLPLITLSVSVWFYNSYCKPLVR